MALLNIVGFESGATENGIEAGNSGGGAGSTGFNGTSSIQSTTKHTGTYAYKVNPTTTGTGFARIYAPIASGGSGEFSAATLFARVYFLYVTKPSSNDEEILQCWTPSTQKFTIRINSSGNLVAYNGTTLLGTGSTVLNASQWYKLEIKGGTGTGGAYELKIDGTSELSGTATFDAANNSTFVLGKTTNRNGNSVEFYYDDIATDDAAYPADGGVVALKANGDGNYTAWTGTFADVDDLPHDGDTTIIKTSTNTNAETEAMENSSAQSISGTINAVKAVSVVGNNSTTVSVKHRLRSSTTDNDTTGFSNTAFVGASKLYVTDPATSLAWTASGIDGVEVGVVHNQAQVREAKCTAVYLMVDFLAPVDFLFAQAIM